MQNFDYTQSTDSNISHDSDYDFRSGCRNVSHHYWLTDNSPFKVENDLASLIYDTRTDLHQKKLKHSRQTTETVETC